MNMGIVDHSSYYTIQDTHCMDTIKECWNEKRAEIVQSLQDRDVAIMTDGGMDSPGHCAQYCTYTTMENESRAILSIITGLKESGLRCSSQCGDVIGVHGGGVVAMVAAGSMVTSSVCSVGLALDPWPPLPLPLPCLVPPPPPLLPPLSLEPALFPLSVIPPLALPLRTMPLPPGPGPALSPLSVALPLHPFVPHGPALFSLPPLSATLPLVHPLHPLPLVALAPDQPSLASLDTSEGTS
ncbi:RNA-binding protein 12-like [Thunnus maccoyii]|uniref:RNA-binding protein 12-like n=1 Tax=Thunnus maccoyii TaxID=8240 RepID=UPI001C4C09AD|nr:RNA-binding protein 12-like [Thunnus maccoyii]